MGEPLSDTALMIAVAAGDREAFAALYERFGGLLLAVGLRMIGGRREAEDVLHDVFIEVWQKAGDYSESRGTVRTWLLLRMRSRVRDRLRSAAVARSAPLESSPEPAMAARQGSEVAANDERIRLNAAIAVLSDEQRRVLELAYFSGLSSREIAAREDIPQGTVKSRMRAALCKLREQLRATYGERA